MIAMLLMVAGIKGGLSIVMLTMIPSSFAHLEMFKVVVIGIILSSTFLCLGGLIFIIAANQAKFVAEKQADEHH
ncbi:MAG: hypothetical protein PHU06_10555 [Gallionella sp.]|nr:hypothetical protein [Gallionella sp.]MDD4959549.1 hypothetical protein [Gallionella sp.]